MATDSLVQTVPAPRPLQWSGAACALAFALLTAVLLGESALLALLLPVFILFLVPLLRSQMAGAILLLFFVPLLSGMPRGQIVPFLRGNEILLALVFGAYMLTLVLGRAQRLPTSFLEKAFLLLLFARSILPLIAHPLDFAGDPTKLVKFFLAPVQYYFIYRLILGAVKREGQILTILRTMILAALIVAIVGLLQITRFPGLAQLYGYYYPSAEAVYTFVHSVRVTSLFHSLSGGDTQFHGGGWNVAGFYLAQSLLIGIVLYQFEPKRAFRRTLMFILPLICLVMVLSFSFTSVISLIAVAIYIGYRRRSLKRYLVRAVPPILIFGSFAAVFFAEEFAQRMSLQFSGTWIPITLLARIDLWMNRALPAVAEHLLLGFGPSRYDWVAAESVYLYIVANCGIFGLAGFIWFLVLVWRRFSALSRLHAPDSFTGALTLLSLGMLLQIALASTTGHYFEFSGASEQLWAVWGVTILAHRMNRPKDAADSSR